MPQHPLSHALGKAALEFKTLEDGFRAAQLDNPYRNRSLNKAESPLDYSFSGVIFAFTDMLLKHDTAHSVAV